MDYCPNQHEQINIDQKSENLEEECQKLSMIENLGEDNVVLWHGTSFTLINLTFGNDETDLVVGQVTKSSINHFQWLFSMLILHKHQKLNDIQDNNPFGTMWLRGITIWNSHYYI